LHPIAARLDVQGETPNLESKVYLSAAELALLCGVTERTTKRWIAEGVMPTALIGGVRRVRRSDVEALFERSEAKT
jgi:excisionase family DNA binding protein